MSQRRAIADYGFHECTECGVFLRGMQQHMARVHPEIARNRASQDGTAQDDEHISVHDIFTSGLQEWLSSLAWSDVALFPYQTVTVPKGRASSQWSKIGQYIDAIHNIDADAGMKLLFASIQMIFAPVEASKDHTVNATVLKRMLDWFDGRWQELYDNA